MIGGSLLQSYMQSIGMVSLVSLTTSFIGPHPKVAVTIFQKYFQKEKNQKKKKFHKENSFIFCILNHIDFIGEHQGVPTCYVFEKEENTIFFLENKYSLLNFFSLFPITI